jgi:hypothetical protein
MGGKIDAKSAFAIAQSIAMGGKIPITIMQTSTGIVALSVFAIAQAVKLALDKSNAVKVYDTSLKTKL